MSQFTPATVKAVLDKIAGGTAAGVPYKATGRTGVHDYKADVATVLNADFPNETHEAREKIAAKLVDQLLTDGKLVKATVKIPRAGGGRGGGKTAEGLTVNWTATEWADAPGPMTWAPVNASPNAVAHLCTDAHLTPFLNTGA